MKLELIYLATPYSDPDPLVKEDRFHLANKVTAMLMNLGHVVFSPISHSHPIAEDADLPGTWEFWENQDRVFLSKCTSVVVINTPGWLTSKGVTAEIEIAHEEFNLPVSLINPHSGVLERLTFKESICPNLVQKLRSQHNELRWHLLREIENPLHPDGPQTFQMCVYCGLVS